jgi:hypothetical protein
VQWNRRVWSGVLKGWHRELRDGVRGADPVQDERPERPRVHVAEHRVRCPLNGPEDRSFDENPQRGVADLVDNGVGQRWQAEAERWDRGG